MKLILIYFQRKGIHFGWIKLKYISYFFFTSISRTTFPFETPSISLRLSSYFVKSRFANRGYVPRKKEKF